MAQNLTVTAHVRWLRADEYEVTVTTQATDSCYKAVSIRHGLPHGKQGVPEIAFVTAELSHSGGPCGDVVHNIDQSIEGVHSSGHSMGVTVFSTVNGEVVGSDHKPFPR